MRSGILAFFGLAACLTAHAADLRLGIIGCDTSHVTAFTEALNNPTNKNHVPGAKVVAAWKGGSPDLVKESMGRVEGYTKTLQEKYHVKFYDSIEELTRNVDAVLIESIDGRPHLDEFRRVVEAQQPHRSDKGATLLDASSGASGLMKPVFIDKPMADSLENAIKIFKLAKSSGTPVFSSSSLRFSKANQAIRNGSLGRVSYAETYGPCELESHHPDLFWYGVHGVEALYTVMGTGCETVQRGTTADGKIEVTGIWPGDRKGVFREDKSFHGIARGQNGEAPAGTFDSYPPLVQAIVKFFETRSAPVTPDETIEILAFMEGADLSKQEGGKPVNVQELIKKSGGLP